MTALNTVGAIPAGWDIKPLCEVAEVLDHLRVPVNSSERLRRGGNVPYYGANGLQGYIDEPLFNEPLILIAEDGGFFDEYETRPIAYCISGPSWVNNHAHVLRPREGTEFSFLFHSLEHKDIRWFIRGGTRSKLNQSELKAITLLVPRDTSEQRAIARILDAADEAIAKTEALIAKLKAIKQGLLHDLLTRGLDENGELRDPERHPEHFKETPLGLIPRSWQVGRLSDYAGVYGGKRLPGGHAYTTQDTGFLYLRVIDFYQRDPDFAKLMHLERRTFDLLSRYEIFSGNIYMSIAGSLGYAGVFQPPRGVRVILTENAARIVPDGQVRPAFLALQLNGPFVQRQIHQAKGISSGVPKLALCRIQNLNIPLPSPKEQERIESAIATHDERIDQEEACLVKLKAIKRGLMQDLLTGRVRVKTEKETREV